MYNYLSSSTKGKCQHNNSCHKDNWEHHYSVVEAVVVIHLKTSVNTQYFSMSLCLKSGFRSRCSILRRSGTRRVCRQLYWLRQLRGCLLWCIVSWKTFVPDFNTSDTAADGKPRDATGADVSRIFIIRSINESTCASFSTRSGINAPWRLNTWATSKNISIRKYVDISCMVKLTLPKKFRSLGGRCWLHVISSNK